MIAFRKSLSRSLLALAVLVLASCSSPLSAPPSAQNTPPPAATTAASVPSLPSATPPSPQTPFPTPAPQPPFVKTENLGFVIGSQPFSFIGANAPYFGYYPQYGLSIAEGIRSARQAGLQVLRIYLAYNDQPWGAKTFEEYDKVLDIASQNGLHVIATLAEGCCLSADDQGQAYFARLPYANLTDQSSLSKYEAFIKTILLRQNTVNGRIYRDDPTIMAWDLINEPPVAHFAPAEFHAWLAQVSAYIKSLDQNHLLTVGLDTSSGIYSTPGDHYTALAVPGIDFFSFHYNLNYFQDVASHLDSIRYRVQMLRSMGKPVVMEEFGIGSQRIFPDNVAPASLVDWVKAYQDQMDTAFSAGAAGALFWGWGVPGTKQVLLWWSDEDHDSGETQFVQMLAGYRFPPASPPPAGAAVIATPQPPKTVPPDVFVLAVCTLIGQPNQKVVSPGSPVVIIWGWSADTPEHLQDYLDNAMTNITLDGQDISSHAPFWVASNEPGKNKIYWFTRVGALVPGSHSIVVDSSWKKMITDGADTYGPGGKTETLHDECEIFVK